MRITFGLLKEMNQLCLQNGSRFIVVVIPTKEMVFAEYLENNPKVYLGNVIDALLTNERSARKELLEFLRESGIRYVDTLPDLQREAGKELYARTDKDMHPGRNGYRVIAESVYRSLKEIKLVD
jgi:lysophospholipase L1-like esterase